MKTAPDIRIAILRVGCRVALAAVLSGCTAIATIQGYPGAPRPSSELATLWILAVEVESIDGTRLTLNSLLWRKTLVSVTAGSHHCVVTAQLASALHQSLYETSEVDIVTIPQHVYYLFVSRHGMHVRLEIRDLGNDYKPPLPPLIDWGDGYRKSQDAAKTLGTAL